MRRATLALLIIVLVLASSLFTYMLVSGYWYGLGIKVPGIIALAITDVQFPLNNTKRFDITVMNPSYSPSDASIEAIYVITPDKKTYKVNVTEPWLPKTLVRGASTTFKCYWNWANYTGDELKIIVMPREGSGASVKARPPAVELEVIPFFNASSPFWFLLNITNSPDSPANVSITRIDVALDNGTWLRKVSTEPAISWENPRVITPNSTLTLNCTWNWLTYRNRTITIVARSVEGYTGYLFDYRTPPDVVLNITEVVFAIYNETVYYFNITVFNSPLSPAPARICNITALVNNTLLTPEQLNITPPVSPSYVLKPNSSVVFTCYWNWSLYEGYNMTITVEAVLGYVANATVNITAGAAPSPVPKPMGRGVEEGASLSSPDPLCSSQALRAPRLCAPRARIQTSALCAHARLRRSSRRVSPPPMLFL